MNYKQRRVCWVALGLFCLSLLAVPVVTFYGAGTGNHVIGGIQWIPFLMVTAHQKVRMDILAIEWIGIAAVAITLSLLLKGRIEIAPPPKEKVKKRSGFWRFIRLLFGCILITALIGAGIHFKIKWDEEQARIKKDQFERSCISKAEAFVTDVKLVCVENNGSKNSYIITGKVQNLSTKYKLTGLCLEVSFIDVLPNGKNEIMASKEIYVVSGQNYNNKIPPDQTCRFREVVEIGDLPVPYGKNNWTYKVSDIRGEADEQIPNDNLSNVQPVPATFNPSQPYDTVSNADPQHPNKTSKKRQGMTKEEALAYLNSPQTTPPQDEQLAKVPNLKDNQSTLGQQQSTSNTGLFDDLLR